MEDVKKQIRSLKGKTENAADLVRLGDLYLTNNDKLEARHYYEEAIAQFPDQIEGYLKMGSFTLENEKLFDANHYFSDALKIDSQNLDALLGTIKVHIEREGLDRAEFFMKSALKHYPNNPVVLFYAGLLYFKKHNLFYAEKYLLEAEKIKDNPMQPFSRFYLGLFEFQRGLFQKALDYFNSLTDRDVFKENHPKNYEAIWNNIGLSHFRLGNYENAQKAYQKVVEKIEKPDAKLFMNIGILYWVQDKLEDALTAIKKAHNISPTLWPWMNEIAQYTSEGTSWLKSRMENLLEENPDGINVGMYLGCVIPNRYPFIDAASRHVLDALKVGVKELEGAGCCPAPGVFRSFDINTWLTLGARNVTVAEDLDRNMCIMCNGCYGTLNDINTELKHDKEKREFVNSKLKEIGKEFKGSIEAEHLVWVLYNDVGIENIKKLISHKLNLKVAVHYGCHILKPTHNKPWKDDFEKPDFLDELVEITGCTSVDYRDKLMCCGAGGGLRGSEKEISLDFTRDKLEAMRKAGVDIIVDCCPFCHLQLDLGQMEINGIFKEQIEGPFKIPVIYISQLLGLAMGIDPFALGLLRYPQKKGVPPFTPVDPIFTSKMNDLEIE